jgi:hypothetical protein
MFKNEMMEWHPKRTKGTRMLLEIQVEVPIGQVRSFKEYSFVSS